jgi:hypothetical protein
MISASSMALATHTPFQVSTSGVLVEGLFSGVVSSATLFQHGDFDLRTFADLDRNGTRDSRAPQGDLVHMVWIDGTCDRCACRKRPNTVASRAWNGRYTSPCNTPRRSEPPA